MFLTSFNLSSTPHIQNTQISKVPVWAFLRSNSLRCKHTAGFMRENWKQNLCLKWALNESRAETKYIQTWRGCVFFVDICIENLRKSHFIVHSHTKNNTRETQFSQFHLKVFRNRNLNCSCRSNHYCRREKQQQRKKMKERWWLITFAWMVFSLKFKDSIFLPLSTAAIRSDRMLEQNNTVPVVSLVYHK